MNNRILLISLSNIGDAIMTTPVLQALHAHFPEASIDIVADQRSAIIFQHCPYRGEIILKQKQAFLRGGPALIRQLRKRHYDLAVDLRTDGLAFLLRADRRLTHWGSKPYGFHAVEQHMGIIRSLYGEQPLPGCCVWPGKEDETAADHALRDYQGKKLLALGPGANYPGKIWPHKAFVNLVQQLRDSFDAVILLGDKKDREMSFMIEKQSALPCVNVCGGTTLLTAAAILRRVNVFVGNDSGLGHLASAVNTPTVTLFGIGQPDRYRPWGEHSRWLVGDGQNIENIPVTEVAVCVRQLC